jgi:hypothetical protein
MPSRFRTRQAGEGKVGCFITLAVLILAIAAAVKAGPVYYSNNELMNAVSNDIAPMASRATDEEILSQIRARAKELNIPEALKAGAVAVTILPSSGDVPGNVHIVIRYQRTVDFYGVYTYAFQTDETLDRAVFTNIR